MSWASTTLTTTTTLETHESEINEITTVANIAAKIVLAKSLLKNKIEATLRQHLYTVDYAEGEVLIDIVANPTTFINCCDYLTLSLVYKDLSKGRQDTLFWDKYLLYKDDYEAEYTIASSRIDIDRNMDGTTDTYQQNIQTYGICKR